MWHEEEDIASTVQGDTMGNGMLMFLFMVVLLLPFIHDPKKKQAENIDPPNQGIFRVEMLWPDTVNCDIDLWVKGPVGPAVGYSNLGGPLWNLLRDDLGVGPSTDMSLRNMEVAFTRGIFNSQKPGDYIVNVHLYSIKGAYDVTQDGKVVLHAEACVPPIPVRIVVSYKENPSAPSQELFYSDVKLVKAKHELTVVRWTVTDYKMDMKSLNKLPHPLIGGNQGDE